MVVRMQGVRGETQFSKHLRDRVGCATCWEVSGYLLGGQSGKHVFGGNRGKDKEVNQSWCAGKLPGMSCDLQARSKKQWRSRGGENTLFVVLGVYSMHVGCP